MVNKHERRGPSVPDFSRLEEDILKRWREKKIFQTSLKATEGRPRFIFFEGPPTANGRPGIHHVLARVFKDVIPRFKTMRGFFVERKAGWDTQGLPVELEVEKQLGLKSKKDVETYGIAKFNEACRVSVWKYKEEWEKLTERIGFWLDLDHPYVTYETPYIESLWWIVKRVWERGLLYRGYKVVPHCPRCGTALSSHEVAQGYQKVTEPSVYVKFELIDEPGTFVLAWTTTPWTLPGNVALAVKKDILYVKTNPNARGERYILASERFRVLNIPEIEPGVGVGGTIPKGLENLRGEELVGKKYKPLFSIPEFEIRDEAHRIYEADFVTTDDGTGVVHTAVMYGEDDYQLGEKVGLPKHHTVTEDGKFTDDVKPWAGRFVKEKEVERQIIQNLNERGLLYKEEPYTHDYPFCWRCDSPLLYYAKNSWFIKMSALREELKKRNATVNWVPEHIKEGRFGEWLNEVKDWAFSRERYWGTPLPLWECPNGHDRLAVGSLEDLEKHAPPRTRMFFMRHGEAENNIEGILSSLPEKREWHLTEKGKRGVHDAAKRLQEMNIARIYASPVLRARETAEILAGALNCPAETDNQLREVDLGVYNGRLQQEYVEARKKLDPFTEAVEGGESLNDLKRRMVAFLKDIARRHRGENVLVVTHGDPIWILDSALRQRGKPETLAQSLPPVGSFVELPLKNYPYNERGAIDPHRPFIDEVTLLCPECKSEMCRVKELCDVWFDSGSMPFAQWHYPFENRERIDQNLSYPADYIAEAIDQTRGWFYTLLAVATLLEKDAPYNNVICLGHVLDDKGRKMSKHVGNVVDPWYVINEYGADALRLYLTTVNQPGDYKLFDAKQVGEVVRKTFLILWNVLLFRDLYAADVAEVAQPRHLLDRWLLSRLERVRAGVTDALERYDVTGAGRLLIDFITELSTWYVRRSRSRFKAEGSDRNEAIATLTTTLEVIAKLLAPLTPFFAELVYERVQPDRPSVHLEPWPDTRGEADEALLREMATTRAIVEIGHALREEARLRVRQPLPQLVMVGAVLHEEFCDILQSELNVREVIFTKKAPTGMEWRTKTVGALVVSLDTTVTDELMAEGWYREVVRIVNDLRKQAKLSLDDRVEVQFATESENVRSMFRFFEKQILQETRANEISELQSSGVAEKTFRLGNAEVRISIRKMKNEK